MAFEFRLPEVERAAHRRALRSAGTYVALWIAGVVVLILGFSLLAS